MRIHCECQYCGNIWIHPKDLILLRKAPDKCPKCKDKQIKVTEFKDIFGYGELSQLKDEPTPDNPYEIDWSNLD